MLSGCATDWLWRLADFAPDAVKKLVPLLVEHDETFPIATPLELCEHLKIDNYEADKSYVDENCKILFPIRSIGIHLQHDTAMFSDRGACITCKLSYPKNECLI